MAPRRATAPANGANGAHAITGPTSALTSFLRVSQARVNHPKTDQYRAQEQGITGNIHRRTQVTPVTAPAPAATDATDGNADASTSAATTVTLEVETGKRKKAQKGGSAKKKKPDAGGEDGERDDFLIAGVKEGPKPGRYDKRAPGSISMCGECGKKFTVTKVRVDPAVALLNSCAR